MRTAILLASLALASTGCSTGLGGPPVPAFEIVDGSFLPGRGPDGNSVLIDAPDGLILVDTGRHPEHGEKILAAIEARGRPVAAIVNTHWHLDHTTGNAEFRAAFPKAALVASRSVDGDLFRQFMAKSRAGSEKYLASGKANAEQQAEIRRGLAVMDNMNALRPTVPVVTSRRTKIAGKTLDLHLASYAATEGDVWLVDPAADVAVVGDLVVGPVPFMDTACIEGWEAALERIDRADWSRLIPGHGAIMDRSGFAQWKTAFGNFVACGRSTLPTRQCADGWLSDAKPFIAAGDEERIARMAAYYIDSRMRSEPEERSRYCRPVP